MMFPDRLLDHAGPGRPCATATVRMAFRHRDVVGARDEKTFAAQWLAYASPCRRFAADLAIDCARLGAGVVRTTFTVEDFHLILLAGLPAHPCIFPARRKKIPCSPAQGILPQDPRIQGLFGAHLTQKASISLQIRCAQGIFGRGFGLWARETGSNPLRGHDPAAKPARNAAIVRAASARRLAPDT